MKVIKRDGSVVDYDYLKVQTAIEKCFAAIGNTDNYADVMTYTLGIKIKQLGVEELAVEEIQDMVEKHLMEHDEYDAAKAYILYRNEKTKQRDANTVPPKVKAAFDRSAKYFESPLQQFQFFDKYSRFDYGKGRRETWEETVARSVQFLREISDYKLNESEYQEIFDGVLEMKVMPSMRLLAMAGDAAKRNNISLYNCSYVPVDNIQSFVEALTISMCGCGVGFSVESQYVNKLPIVKETIHDLDVETWLVEDSATGWADALDIALKMFWSGNDIKFDLSLLRPAGAILKTKGGRSSGPTVLRDMLNSIKKIIRNRAGKYIRPIDAHDIMCIVGEAAVQGGTRRTAMISLFDFDDKEMLNAKEGDLTTLHPYRWNANNSAVWPDRKLSQAEVMEFFGSIVKGGTGEPGIFNRRAAKNTQPEHREDAEFGTNPSLRAGTKVYTTDGIYPIEQLVGKRISVRNHAGQISDAECFLSGKNKPLYEIMLSNGISYHATAEHKWPVVSGNTTNKVTSVDLKIGDKLPVVFVDDLLYGVDGDYDDGFLAGWITGDGWITTRSDDGTTQVGLILSSEDWGSPIKDRLLNKLRELGCGGDFSKRIRGGQPWYEININNSGMNDFIKRFGVLPKKDGLASSIWSTASEDFRKGFVDAIVSSDGNVEAKSSRICVSTAHKKLAHDISDLLGFYGLSPSISEITQKGVFPNGKDYGKTYTGFKVRFGGQRKIQHFMDNFSLTHPRKNNLLNGIQVSNNSQAVFCSVISVELTKMKEDVYDISVYDTTHTFQLSHCVTGNCGEIVLRPMGFCNLSSVVCRRDDQLEELKGKVRLATIIGTLQSMATDFHGLRPEWTKNAVEERLLGVDLNALMDCAAARRPWIQSALRYYAVLVNEQYAARLGINKAASVTCVKPSGNSSTLLNTSSGLHPRWSEYYIRNVRVSAHSPLKSVLEASGVPMSPENGQIKETATTFVAHFPVKSPEGAITKDDLTAIDKCNYWLQVKNNWTTHNPSVTITYKDDEVIDIAKWIYEHQDVIGGMAFLPHSDSSYDQMPYEEITEKDYVSLIDGFPLIDFSKIHLYELEDMTTAAQELSCMSGQCEF